MQERAQWGGNLMENYFEKMAESLGTLIPTSQLSAAQGGPTLGVLPELRAGFSQVPFFHFRCHSSHRTLAALSSSAELHSFTAGLCLPSRSVCLHQRRASLLSRWMSTLDLEGLEVAMEKAQSLKPSHFHLLVPA